GHGDAELPGEERLSRCRRHRGRADRRRRYRDVDHDECSGQLLLRGEHPPALHRQGDWCRWHRAGDDHAAGGWGVRELSYRRRPRQRAGPDSGALEGRGMRDEGQGRGVAKQWDAAESREGEMNKVKMRSAWVVVTTVVLLTPVFAGAWEPEPEQV